MQHFGKGALRVAKNYTKGYSDTQAKVRDATSNDPWGPSGTQMNEIAQLTYNQTDFVEIMEMLDKRLNDKGKNWRHVFKSLTVLDYCLHQGSENVVIYFRDNLYIIKTLKEFQYIDEDSKDQGANVRQKAKDITALLMDESRLREARRQRAQMRDRMIRGVDGAPDNDFGYEDENVQRRNGNGNTGSSARPGRTAPRDDEDLQRAIEESKKLHAVDELREAEERDLQRAIKLSEEEEKRRREAVDNSNAASLFDEQNQLNSPASSNDNAFPFTDPTPYAVGLQPQLTQVQPQFTAVQPQFTSFNPYQQQAEQEAAQAEYLRQQQAFLLQQQQAQHQAQQAQQEEWLRQQQLLQMQQQQEQLQQLQLQQQQQQQQQQNLFLQAQQLSAQPTGFGSNNPFAPPQPTGATSSFSPSPQPQRQQPQFNLQGTYNTHSTSNLSSLTTSATPASQPRQSPRPAANLQLRKEGTEHEQRLADLFANRDDGQDTFGNIGALRYGHTDAGRVVLAQRTGASHNNPFAQQQNNERPFFDI